MNEMLRALLLFMSTLVPSGQPGPMQPADYKPAGQSHVVSWQVKRVPPPSPLYIDVDDQLVATAQTLLANEVVVFNYRWLRASDGVIERGQFQIGPIKAALIGVTQVVTQPLAEGFLLSLSVRSNLAQTRGQTFVRAFLGAGAYGAGQPSYMLMSDYVTNAMAPGFPNGRNVSPVEGPGWIHTRVQNNPAAGVDFGLTNVGTGRMRVIYLAAVFTTSVQAGNRNVLFKCLSDSLVDAGVYSSNLTQPPSQAVRYVFSDAPFISQAPLTNQQQIPMPVGLILGPSETIEAQTFGLQSGDQGTLIELQVEEWLDNA